MSLFDCGLDYGQDIFRNIPSIKDSQHLFDDLSSDPQNWEAANQIDIATHTELRNSSIIQRAFDYSKNEFIDYPFENITASRFNDGSFACWYGSETLETSIFETVYHLIQTINDSLEAFEDEDFIDVDRKVGEIYCEGLAFDLTSKINEYPWLIDSTNYLLCQNLGKRIAQEGHPLLRVPSARDSAGVNLVAFNANVLSNPRNFCYLRYQLDLRTMEPIVYRGNEKYLLDLN